MTEKSCDNSSPCLKTGDSLPREVETFFVLNSEVEQEIVAATQSVRKQLQENPEHGVQKRLMQLLPWAIRLIDAEGTEETPAIRQAVENAQQLLERNHS